MTSAYGFRIYVVQAFPNRKKDRDPLEVHSTSATRDRIVELLESLASDGTAWIVPKVPPKPGDPAKPTVSVTVGEPAVVRDDLVHLEVSEGELGAHRKATRQKKKAVSLEDASAEADHYVTFVFPEDEGERFFIVGQTYRRREPVARLLALMTKRSLELKSSAIAAQKAERAALKAAGEKLPKKEAFDRLLFDRRQAVDTRYLDSIIRDAKTVRVDFERHVPSDRRSGTRVQRSLRFYLDEEERKAGTTVGRRWTGRRRRGEVTSREAGVEEMSSALRDLDLMDEDEEQGYDEASIHLSGGAAGSTTIAVDTLREVFTYGVSDGRPPVVYYYDKVTPRLNDVAAEEKIELKKFDGTEVDQCLDDSTSDLS